MPFVNGFVEIVVGNVTSRLRGPAPRQRLFRALNPHVSLRALGERGPPDAGSAGQALVYEPVSETFLTGALPTVKRVLRGVGTRFRVRDLRSSPRPRFRWRVREAVLRDYQKEVVEAAVRTGHGLIDVGTGGGKTLLAAAILARLGLQALYLVTTRTLLAQTLDSLQSLLGVKPGRIGQGLCCPAPITVALVQSLESDKVDLSPWRSGVLVFDEGHHAAARTYTDLVRRVSPRYHFYLSAVPFRRGADQVVLDAIAGRPLTDGRYSARFLIERGYACEIRVRVERCRMQEDMREKSFGTLYREHIVCNTQRNGRIAEISREESARGRSVLALVEHVRHGNELLRLLGKKASFVHGGVPRAVLKEKTVSFASGRLRCLIATRGLFMEGVSIHGIQVLINAGGLKSRARVLQTVGRGMRRAPGKARCLYIDFWDEDSACVFQAHSRERFRFLKEEGFFVPPLASAAEPLPPPTPIPPTWWRVPGRPVFLLVDAEGSIRARAPCRKHEAGLQRSCRRCDGPCNRGGGIEWLADPR
jgi:superfamily II DNA or RNA helicase